MSKDVLPKNDAAFDAFQLNLFDKATTNQAIWNIPATALAVLMVVKTPWDAAWLIAKSKSNRTATQVSTKNVARRNYEKKLRPFIQSWIYRNDSMDDNAIVECGLKPRDKTRTPVSVPVTVPVITMEYATGNVLVIRFLSVDPDTAALRKAKPKGVSRIQLSYVIGVQPASPDACPNTVEGSRTPVRVNIDTSVRGQMVWYYARWVNTRNQPGPWTDLDSFVF
ncbi:MAG: hypothetical protein AB7P01_06785 [Bacteroidia bacterium]